MNRYSREDLAGIEQPLADFRDAVRAWSEAECIPAVSPPLLPRREGFLLAGRAARAGASSILLHAAAFAMMLSIGLRTEVSETLRPMGQEIQIYFPKPIANRSNGGGGGGAREAAEASRGALPKASPRQFTPPSVRPVEAELMMTPSIVIPSNVLTGPQYGDPFSAGTRLSNGPGAGGGIGSGLRGGVGPGSGPGAGPGIDGGIGGGVFRAGGAVQAPRLLKQVEPEYSDEARKARWHGTVTLSVVVDEAGRPRDIRIMRRLGLGLDEKAIEAVRQWEFRPGMLDGRPVPVYAVVEVNFRLL